MTHAGSSPVVSLSSRLGMTGRVGSTPPTTAGTLAGVPAVCLHPWCEQPAVTRGRCEPHHEQHLDHKQDTR